MDLVFLLRSAYGLPRGLVLAALCAALPGAAQTRLSLQSAIETALRAHPALQAGAARLAAAQGFQAQAALRPNPRLTLQTENWRAWGAPGLHVSDQVDTYLYISQPIETAGKRARRIDLARTTAARTGLERELAASRIVAAVKQAYWKSAAASRVQQAWLDNVRNFRQIVEYHEIRVREGSMAEADLLKVRLEAERLALAANTAALEAAQARVELIRAMGISDFPEFQASDAIEDSPAPPAANLQRALESRIEMKIAGAALEEAEANVRVQKSLAAPGMDAMWGYKRTAGFNTLFGGVQIDLPMSNRNQGNIAAADALARAARSDMAAARVEIGAELRLAAEQAAARHAQVTGALRQLTAQAAESSQIALAAYREGGADLLRLVDAERVRIELEALYYRTLGEYRQSVAALESAMGVNQ